MSTESTLWTCTKCGEAKPPEEYYISSRTRCKECKKALSKRQYWRDPEASREWHRKYRRDNLEMMRERKRLNEAKHRDKRIIYKRKYYRENSEAVKQKAHEYRKGNLERCREYDRRYAKEHSKEAVQRAKKWVEDNPERARENSRRAVHMRRTRFLAAGGKISAEQWSRMLEGFEHTCPGCGRGKPEITLTMDHVRSVAEGGSTDVTNVQPLCGPCNRRKFKREIRFRPWDGRGPRSVTSRLDEYFDEVKK
jgi:5-methylcytosine-specific restriction endonuclease McrA